MVQIRIMKHFIKVLSIICFIGITSCKKNGTTLIYGAKDSSWVYVDSCKTFGINTTSFIICFDSLLNESRCPIGAMCPWEGYALARFKVTQGNQQYFIKLATINVSPYKNDTTINAVKFRLDSLLPYPTINIPHPYSAYKAKIVITQ